jgi:hypothetical protein
VTPPFEPTRALRGPEGMVGRGAVVYEGVLPVPGLLPPLTPRRACAPKDIRRAKGVVGALRPGPSSSSMAFSSNDSEPAVEMLPRRALNGNGDVCVGEPDKPSVEIDMRRR